MKPPKLESHWDDVYRRKGAADVSWFQPTLAGSLRMIDSLKLPKGSTAIDVGAGASTLVDDLLAREFGKVTVLDLSAVGLEVSRQRLGERAERVEWIVGDITAMELPENAYDLWHDRAVFHFLTDEKARAAYVENAARALKPGGHIIVATFGLEGPEQCSGLDVVRYDASGLHAEFGQPFAPIEHVKESHKTPWGKEQEFIYCYCRRVG